MYFAHDIIIEKNERNRATWGYSNNNNNENNNNNDNDNTSNNGNNGNNDNNNNNNNNNNLIELCKEKMNCFCYFQ